MRSNSLDSFDFAKHHSIPQMPLRSNNQDSFNIALAMGDNKHVCTLLVQFSQAESANNSYSEISSKLYRFSVD